jgi:very-short-patch-repair endonuclease
MGCLSTARAQRDETGTGTPTVRGVKIDTLLATEGPVFHLRSLPPATRATVKSAHEAGRLVRLLPGTYVTPDAHDDFATRCAAVAWWCPDAVIVGAAAARLTFWPDLSVRVIDVARRGYVPNAPGYTFERRIVDPELVVVRHGLRLSSPALTAVDLVPHLGGDALDTCLRARAARLEDLWAAFHAHPSRAGNLERHRMLVDSRDKPWSAAERLSHRLLRRHGIVGWTANLEVRVHGLSYFIDIAFRAERLAVEIDGRLHEDDPAVFESDRYRQNALVTEGWRVLRFTYGMLVDRPQYVVDQIRAALAES